MYTNEKKQMYTRKVVAFPLTTSKLFLSFFSTFLSQADLYEESFPLTTSKLLGNTSCRPVIGSPERKTWFYYTEQRKTLFHFTKQTANMILLNEAQKNTIFLLCEHTCCMFVGLANMLQILVEERREGTASA